MVVLRTVPSDRESHQSKGENGKEFAQAIARVAVAQVCESLGFQSFQHSALETLADVGIRYIMEVGKGARSCANSANRTQCNVFDVIQVLEDLGSIQGFPGASDVSQSLSLSGVVRDMIRYLCKAEEIRFAYSVPSFPLVKKRKLDPSFAQAEENPPNVHIPTWLPRFPDPKACLGLSPRIEGSLVNEIAETDDNQRNQKLLCNGSKAEGATEEADTGNPFLALPLPFQEKEGSFPVGPGKLLNEDVGRRHQSCEVIESHLLNPEPSANGTERSDHSESDDRRKFLANGRSSVHFKFGNGKKPFSIGKISVWFGDDQDGIDENKMKAERILLETTESPPKASLTMV